MNGEYRKSRRKELNMKYLKWILLILLIFISFIFSRLNLYCEITTLEQDKQNLEKEFIKQNNIIEKSQIRVIQIQAVLQYILAKVEQEKEKIEEKEEICPEAEQKK